MPRLAVLGYPVSHSRSPAMQTAALAELGLGDEWTYEAIEVEPAAFAELVGSLPDAGFAGVNVTVPHKLAALALADSRSEAAAAIGAANTLSFDRGAITAENTDAVGITGAIGEPVAGLRALVLGAGGSARAAIWALREAGAHVSVWNRTPAKAQALAKEFDVALERGETRDEELDLSPYGVVLNATTFGLHQAADHDPTSADLQALPLASDSFGARQIVVDLVYGPHETALTSAARQRGSRVIDGLEVLVHQGAASLRIWTGREPPLETMHAAARGIRYRAQRAQGGE
jgi:shikimate dehydrogenase